MEPLGIEYLPERWPHGLRCADCHRAFADGDRYSEQLVAISNDIPVIRIVCAVCVQGD